MNENSFVEKRLQEGIIRQLSRREMDHYQELRARFRDPKALEILPSLKGRDSYWLTR